MRSRLFVLLLHAMLVVCVNGCGADADTPPKNAQAPVDLDQFQIMTKEAPVDAESHVD